jgi:hypothetical protein
LRSTVCGLRARTSNTPPTTAASSTTAVAIHVHGRPSSCGVAAGADAATSRERIEAAFARIAGRRRGDDRGGAIGQQRRRHDARGAAAVAEHPVVGRPVDAQVLAVAGRVQRLVLQHGRRDVGQRPQLGLGLGAAHRDGHRGQAVAAGGQAGGGGGVAVARALPHAAGAEVAIERAVGVQVEDDGARDGDAGDLAGDQHRAVGQRQQVVGLDGDAGRRELHLALHAPVHVGVAVGLEARDDRLRLVAREAGAHHPGAARGVDAHAGRRVVAGAERERRLAVAAEVLVGSVPLTRCLSRKSLASACGSSLTVHALLPSRTVSEPACAAPRASAHAPEDPTTRARAAALIC